jgi:hypothetical protein
MRGQIFMRAKFKLLKKFFYWQRKLQLYGPPYIAICAVFFSLTPCQAFLIFLKKKFVALGQQKWHVLFFINIVGQHWAMHMSPTLQNNDVSADNCSHTSAF